MTEISPAQFVAAAVVVVIAVWLGSRALDGAPGSAGPVAAAVAGTRGTARGEPGTGAGGVKAGTGAVVTRPPARRIVVHVAGAVRRPGVYRLRTGERIADAVRRAGGAARSADLDAVNLAAQPRDGVQILVPRRTGTAAAGAPAPAAPGVAPVVVDLNTATADQLDTLDGVGPATAAKILQYRAEHGPFRSVDDLEQIPGIGPKKLAAIRPRARV